MFERTNKLQELKTETDKKKKTTNIQSTHGTSIVDKEVKTENKQIRQLNETSLKYKIGF